MKRKAPQPPVAATRKKNQKAKPKDPSNGLYFYPLVSPLEKLIELRNASYLFYTMFCSHPNINLLRLLTFCQL